jgi:hypothetical protein
LYVILTDGAARIDRLKPSDYAVLGAPHLKNPYAIIYSSGPDVLTEATFYINKEGKRVTKPAGVLVIAKDKCHMRNKAHGSWLGDDNPATTLPPRAA